MEDEKIYVEFAKLETKIPNLADVVADMCNILRKNKISVHDARQILHITGNVHTARILGYSRILEKVDEHYPY